MKTGNYPRISLGNINITSNILSDYFNKGQGTQITDHYYILIAELFNFLEIAVIIS